MDWLKNLIGDEAYSKLEEENKELIEKLRTVNVLDPEKHIPKDKFNEVNIKKKELEEELTKVSGELEEVKNRENNIKQETEIKIVELSGRVEELTNRLTEKETMLGAEQKKSVLLNHLNTAKANPKYVKYLINEFDLDVLEIENDAIKNWEEILTPVREVNKELFGEIKLSGTMPTGGARSKDRQRTLSSEEYYAQVFNRKK